MKALLINGSPNQLGCTYTALSKVERILNENGIQSEILYLGKMPVAGCIACGTMHVCRILSARQRPHRGLFCPGKSVPSTKKAAEPARFTM